MGVRRLAGVGLLTMVLALGAAAAPALADEALLPSGALTYTWHGDPTRGCAQVGVCGVQGVIIVRPDDEVDFSPGSLSFNDVSASVRVRRTDPGSAGNCIDPQSAASQIDEMFLSSGPGDSVRATLATAPSSGQCAGPVETDLEGLALHGTRSAGKRPSFDFRGATAFTAGPYSGELTSSLTLKPYRPIDTNLFGGSSGSSGASGSNPRQVLVSQLDLRYRVSVTPATLGVTFRGLADPFCEAFDSCGTSGRLALALSRGQDTVEVTASRRVTRPLTRSQALAEFRAGKLVIGNGFGWVNEAEVLTEQLARPGAPTCSGERILPAPAELSLGSTLRPIGGHQVPITVATGIPSGSSNQGFDAMRTHCPGPSQNDVFGLYADPVIMRGSISRVRLLASRATATVVASGGFTGSGYTGSRTGAVGVSLTLEHVHVSTFMAPAGS